MNQNPQSNVSELPKPAHSDAVEAAIGATQAYMREAHADVKMPPMEELRRIWQIGIAAALSVRPAHSDAVVEKVARAMCEAEADRCGTGVLDAKDRAAKWKYEGAAWTARAKDALSVIPQDPALHILLEWTEKGIANHGERSCVQRKIKELIAAGPTPAQSPALMECVEALKKLALEMGRVIRALDESGEHSEFWTQDGNYIIDGRFPRND